jgi:F-type H+-transporting ATPase subunit a
VGVEAPVLADLSLSLTNIGLYLTIGGCLLFVVNIISTNDNKILSNT